MAIACETSVVLTMMMRDTMQNFFDSTGTTSAIFTAAKKGVSGTWSATSARRRSRRSEIPEGEGEEEEVVEQGEFDFDVQLDDEVVLEEDIDEEWSVPVMSQLEDRESLPLFFRAGGR